MMIQGASKFIVKTLSFFVLLLVASCSTNQTPPTNSNYNQGFNQNQQNQQYQQPTYSAPQAPAGQNYYNQPAPYYNSGYQYQQRPASKYYSNPYAVQQQAPYPYYDGDQYYVPPTSYGVNSDNMPPSFSNQKF